ncbi:MAG: hypothetical protein ACRDAM_02135 [Casimicrobium sp.]
MKTSPITSLAAISALVLCQAASAQTPSAAQPAAPSAAVSASNAAPTTNTNSQIVMPAAKKETIVPAGGIVKPVPGKVDEIILKKETIVPAGGIVFPKPGKVDDIQVKPPVSVPKTP